MKEALAAMQSAGRIVITSHIKPDGDAVGSTVALLRALKKIGKECHAISPSHIPSGFEFVLRDQQEVVRYNPERDDPILARADLYVLMDCSDLERAGVVGRKMEELGKPKLMIDHHSTNENFGTINYVNFDVSSTSELLMEILAELQIPLSLDLALPLYVGIVTDTGDFNYPGTTPQTHARAGLLIQAGIKPYEVHRKLSLDRSLDFIRLTGLAVFNTQIGYGGEVAYSVVHHDLYRKFTPRADELVMLPPYLLSIQGVEVGALFLEYEPKLVVVELRSQGLVNVADIARTFGGGGHSGAGGARVEGEVADIVHLVLSEIEERLEAGRQRGTSEELRSEVWCRT